ncbi:uncharacterized protein LOC116346662 isoform X2 [Contarinia nasturtii]|uniref:uncharacterized protein LOC116346662 isoform X2 n=1 Tax=Contarinia nasturtii TaxID=265458 RepID=UPI0012D49E5F|nr:uncharacterized protein LOC116346662 isoform X2 [Contarinia nasturtii]XP_031632695.1 uncharacterized protein LOC116346662 isoform X2 [Contarinia nasturtii]
MNRKLLSLFFISIITLELLVPCANAGSGKAKSVKNVVKAMGEGTVRTAKSIGKSGFKAGKHAVQTVGFGVMSGIGYAGTVAMTPLACVTCGNLGTAEATQLCAGAALIGQERAVINGGKTIGRTIETAGKIAGLPLVCGHKSMKAMQEIEEREEEKEQNEVTEEERRNKLKSLPEP